MGCMWNEALTEGVMTRAVVVCHTNVNDTITLQCSRRIRSLAIRHGGYCRASAVRGSQPSIDIKCACGMPSMLSAKTGSE